MSDGVSETSVASSPGGQNSRHEVIARPVGMLSHLQNAQLGVCGCGTFQHSLFLWFNGKVTSYWRKTHIFVVFVKKTCSLQLDFETLTQLLVSEIVAASF